MIARQFTYTGLFLPLTRVKGLRGCIDIALMWMSIFAVFIAVFILYIFYEYLGNMLCREPPILIGFMSVARPDFGQVSTTTPHIVASFSETLRRGLGMMPICL